MEYFGKFNYVLLSKQFCCLLLFQRPTYLILLLKILCSFEGSWVENNFGNDDEDFLTTLVSTYRNTELRYVVHSVFGRWAEPSLYGRTFMSWFNIFKPQFLFKLLFVIMATGMHKIGKFQRYNYHSSCHTAWCLLDGQALSTEPQKANFLKFQNLPNKSIFVQTQHKKQLL